MEGPTSDDNSDFAPDDAFNMICGDLGLGENSRSSASLRYELEVLSQSDSPESFEKCKHKPLASGGKDYSDDVARRDSKSRSSSVEENHTDDKAQSKLKSAQKDKSRRKSESNSKSSKSGDESRNGGSEEYFPSYADVPYGTSLRQQKKLYEQNLGSIIEKHSCSLDGDNTPTDEAGKKALSSEEIDRRLWAAVEEVEELKQDLEVCKQRLDAKYNAINILKKQAEENNHEHFTNELKAKEASLKLAEEVNKLQFELQFRESSFQDSQQTWAQRFDRVCQENALLNAQLEARSEELRRANTHRMSLRRERDELLALLDIKERNKYEMCHSQSSEEEFSQYTNTELAVLGACRCRGANGMEPCGCAYAAANLTREIIRLREEAKQMLQRRDEAYRTVDAYRLAFEEQLQKSRTMTQQLASMATCPTRAVKTKAAIKFLLSVLADDDYPPVKSKDGGDTTQLHSKESLGCLTLPELVTLLTEMLHEKKEALVHQKLAGQVLTAKLQETERKLQSLTEADGDVNHS
ncbi:coiled-coil domain-containing protein 125-like isoform X2 [Littorina saxatilis]|uniref:coiled-coil domain-containing protein 125-like isoform X2 n=1 Tax=Littorina saxatilis TaxID=31220 RepID=UPI0038B55637